MINLDYIKTIWVLRKKWFLNKTSRSRSLDFQPFIILCSPRTGSTLLHTYLNSHSNILSYGELSSIDMNLENWPLILKHPSNIHAVGVKLFYNQLASPAFAQIMNWMIDNEKVRIINLTRENHLQSFVSLKLAEASQQWSSSKESSHTVKIKVDKKEFDQYGKRLSQEMNYVLSQLSKEQVLDLTYEKLISDRDNQLMRFQNFIRVKPKRLFSLLKKQNNRPMSEIVENYSEIPSQLINE